MEHAFLPPPADGDALVARVPAGGCLRRSADGGWAFERRADMRARINSVRAEAQRYSTALDRMPQPVFICSDDARLLFQNAAAAALLQRGQGLRADGDRLAADRACDDAALQRAILQTARMAGVGARGVSRASAIVHREQAPPLIVQVSPLPRDLEVDESCEASLVVVIDPSVRRAPSPTLLFELFALTPAETRLAMVIAEEPQLSLGKVAQLLGLAEPTVKSQLAAIFQKTCTNRRAELAGLLTRLSAL